MTFARLPVIPITTSTSAGRESFETRCEVSDTIGRFPPDAQGCQNGRERPGAP